MQAKDLEEGDILFSPEGINCKVTYLYYAADDVIVVSFGEGYGIQVHPNRDLLVARKGQVL